MLADGPDTYPHDAVSRHNACMTDELEFLLQPGSGLSRAEAEFLRALAAAAGEGCLLAAHSAAGALALALGAPVARGRMPSVYWIEPGRSPEGELPAAREQAVLRELTRRARATPGLALVELAAEQLAPGWTTPIALALLDGRRSEAELRRAFACWSPHVLAGGVIAVGGAAGPAPAARALIEELRAAGGYRELPGAGGIRAFKKTRIEPPGLPQKAQRILVACERIVLTGGLLRFDRVARALAPWGHRLSFLVLGDTGQGERPTDMQVLDLESASKVSWDAVMVPGAGFSEAFIRRLAELRESRFGVRVQHVLNDRSRRERFLKVNAAFAPDVVVFNNDDWSAGSFTDFRGRRFHLLPGAVDTEHLRPTVRRPHALVPGRWRVGGLANKNPEALIGALRRLDASVQLRLFGRVPEGLAERHADLLSSARLEFVGALDEAGLSAFQREVDCVASVELNAGWANLAAEAAAAGTPLVCTPHGTRAFARDGETALVVAAAEPGALAAAIERLRADPTLCARLAEAARTTIEAFSWRDYARELLRLSTPSPAHYYLYAPELGLHGKWPIRDRLAGLEPLLAEAAGRKVIDFGAAEGFIAREFLQRGARLVHGFELDPFRVGVANSLVAEHPLSSFREANLDALEDFRSANADLLLPAYDIVLYLGIHHHLREDGRLAVLDYALALAREWFALRTPPSIAAADGLTERILAAGFRRQDREPAEASPPGRLGALAIYRRIAG